MKAAIMNKNVERGRDLDDSEVLQVVASLVKQRRDSIDQFAKAGRTDLVDKDKGEIAVLEQYQPPAATVEEIEAFHELVRPHGIKELVRTGRIGLARASSARPQRRRLTLLR